MSSYVAFKTNIAVVEPTDATIDFLSLELTILISGTSYDIHLPKFLNYPVFCIFLTKTWKNPALTVC